MRQWSIALIALVIVLTVNMISVKLFGEMEFWAALMDEFLDKDNERRD
jgi:L-asparagine permease